jgi:3-phenylpropionate/trans-cinnamate dioxygenase ferredoxin subunit
VSGNGGFVAVARVGEIPEGGVKVVRLEDQSVAVFHVGGRYWALEDVCTHDGGPLAEGYLDGEVIECPRHGARFSVKDGSALSLPATAAVPAYAVRVVGEEIQVGWGVAYAAASPPAAGNTGAAGPVSAPGGQSSPRATPVAPASAAPGTPAGATGAAPSQQEMAVRAALETVMDPEIGLSVIDLGLIREIHLLPDRTHVKMMLTTPFCPYAPQMMEDVKQAVQGVVVLPCEVEILPDPWSPDLMPDPGLLGYSF